MERSSPRPCWSPTSPRDRRSGPRPEQDPLGGAEPLVQGYLEVPFGSRTYSEAGGRGRAPRHIAPSSGQEESRFPNLRRRINGGEGTGGGRPPKREGLKVDEEMERALDEEGLKYSSSSSPRTPRTLRVEEAILEGGRIGAGQTILDLSPPRPHEDGEGARLTRGRQPPPPRLGPSVDPIIDLLAGQHPVQPRPLPWRRSPRS